MTYILGLNAYHADAAACLVKDGELIAAVEEERFRRVKHWGGFPSESIRYCLKEAGISLGDVDHVAVNTDNRANRWRKLAFVVTSGVSPGYVLNRIRARSERTDIAGNLRSALPEQEFRGTVHAVEHHVCHLASAFQVSPYDKAVAVSVDGFGDFSSAAWGLGEGGTLTVDGRVYFPHSLGVFYEAMTQFIGFPHYGDEYKVMGLAPYGEPRFVEQMKQILKLNGDGTFALDLRYFRHASGEGANYQVKDGIPSGGRLWSDALAGLLGPARESDAPLEDKHRDIARSAQATYENAFFNLLNALHARYGSDAVVIAGGCAYNSVANGKIFERSPFKHVYVQSAGGDAGGSIGAAFATWHKLGGRSTCTMLFGHVESLADRVDHLRQLRALQDETRGFSGFVALPYQPENNGIPVEHPPTGYDSLRTLAVSRLYLDNFDHITAYWVGMGLKLAQVALSYGADDLHGTIGEEHIFHMAGAKSPQLQTEAEMLKAIREAGRVPVQRDTFYEPVKEWPETATKAA